jgi:beta-xylosidase
VSARRPPSPYAWIRINGKRLLSFAEGGDTSGAAPGTTDGDGNGCGDFLVGVHGEGVGHARLVPAVRRSGAGALALACAVTLASSAGCARSEQSDLRYRNPVFGLEFPDPVALRAGRDYYAYGSTVFWRGRRRLLPILRSHDLIHWRYSGDAFRRPPRWTRDRWWAPGVLRRGDTYYLYYSAQRRPDGRHCIAVATANRPRGPFRSRSVLACGRPGGYIDPAPFIDSDGRAYLYFARADTRCRVRPRYCFISAVRLRDDLLRVVGRRRIVLGVSELWEVGRRSATVENPWLVKRGRRYYLLYSANDWQRKYAMGYAVSSSPLGPFVKGSRPILERSPEAGGPGGGSVVVGPHGGDWLVYHARRTRRRPPGDRPRLLHIDPISWADGRPEVEGPSAVSSRFP